jgi:hypothetical protein
MVGGFPRKEGMERKEARSLSLPALARSHHTSSATDAECACAPQVMGKNVSIYKSQASALEKFAAKDCKARKRPAHTHTAQHTHALTTAALTHRGSLFGSFFRWLWSPTRPTPTR